MHPPSLYLLVAAVAVWAGEAGAQDDFCTDDGFSNTCFCSGDVVNCDFSERSRLPFQLNVPRTVKTLSFFKNQIKLIGNKFTQGSINAVEEINLGSNQIDSIKTENFFRLQKLRVLLLNDNNIASIESGSFGTQVRVLSRAHRGSQRVFATAVLCQ